MRKLAVWFSRNALVSINVVTFVEFYFYPTVITALIHLIKPGLIRWDGIEYDERSNWVVIRCVVIIGRIATYKIFY